MARFEFLIIGVVLFIHRKQIWTSVVFSIKTVFYKEPKGLYLIHTGDPVDEFPAPKMIYHKGKIGINFGVGTVASIETLPSEDEEDKLRTILSRARNRVLRSR